MYIGSVSLSARQSVIPLTPPPMQVFFLKNKKNAQNVQKHKNMHKYVVTFLQGYPLKKLREGGGSIHVCFFPTG